MGVEGGGVLVWVHSCIMLLMVLSEVGLLVNLHVHAFGIYLNNCKFCCINQLVELTFDW